MLTECGRNAEAQNVVDAGEKKCHVLKKREKSGDRMSIPEQERGVSLSLQGGKFGREERERDSIGAISLREKTLTDAF